MMGIVKVIVPIIVTVITTFILQKMIMNFWVAAKPNEWLLVIRSGKLKAAGIGGC